MPADEQTKRARAARIPPASKSAVRSFASGTQRVAGKVAKGTGIVGTALGAYTDVKEEGLGKGSAKTAAGGGATYATTAGVALACAAAGVATAGVGAVACGVGAVVLSAVTSKYFKDAVGLYDRAPGAARAVKDFAVETTKPAVEAVGRGVEKIGAGAAKVGSALNPFG